MTALEEDLRTLLLTGGGSPAPLAAVGVHWNDQPQAAPVPCIVLWKVTDLPDYAMEGVTGLENVRIQCDCKAADYAAAKQLERAVKGVVSGFRGTVGDTDFQGIFIDGSRDGVEPAGGASSERRDVCSLDLVVWFGAT